METQNSSGMIPNIISKVSYPFQLLYLATGVIPKLMNGLISPKSSRESTKKDSFEVSTYTTRELSSYVTFMSANKSAENVKSVQDLNRYTGEGRPLCLLICWLMAEHKAVKNYAKFYIDSGFDVIAFRITVLDVLIPSRADEIIKTQALPILARCRHQKKIIHGFSVAGYIWTRFIKQREEDLSGEYIELFESFQCQVWDSVADIHGVQVGVSSAMFPKSPMFQNMFHSYADFHMKIFYNFCTKYYIEANHYAYNKPIKAPALFLFSNVDVLSSAEQNEAMMKSWKSYGVDCIFKLFEGTAHVMHMRSYPVEYQSLLKQFFQKNGVIV